MKKLNLPLIFGGVLILAILFIILFPQHIAKLNPYTMQGIQVSSNGSDSLKVQGAPFPPSKVFLLGSDALGRDLFSIIIYGTRLTMMLSLLIVLGRFLVAVPIGMAAGFGSSTCRAIINQFSIIFSAIPGLILSVVILKLAFFTSLDKEHSILAFVIVLTLAGWSKLGVIVMERVRGILSLPFIKGEVAIGKSRLRIAFENVLPHLSSELIVLFFMEIAMALAIIMQLGIFSVFVGNVRVLDDLTRSGIVNVSFEPEWASMLSTSIAYMDTAPLMVLAPAAAFFISILGFNLFGEGLRINMQKKDSKFPYYFRRIFSLNKSVFSHKNLKKASISLAVIAAVICTAFSFLKSKENFDLKASLGLLKGDFKDQVVIGSSEADYTANLLQSALKELNFKPLSGSSFLQEYTVDSPYAEKSGSFSISGGGKALHFKEGTDYGFIGLGNYDFSGRLYDALKEDLYSVKDFSVFDDKFVLIDGNMYSSSAVKYFIKTINEKSRAKGILCILPDNTKMPYPVQKEYYNIAALFITSKTADIIKADNTELNISLSSEKLGNTGKNILGILPGEAPRIGKQAIIIGTGYNYTPFEKDITKSKIMLALELAEKLKDQDRERSIILAFFDGNLNEDLSGIKVYAKNPLYPLADSMLYIDLSKIKSENNSLLYYNSDQCTINRYSAWGFNRQLESNLKSASISTVEAHNERSLDDIFAKGANSDEAMYYVASIPTINFYTVTAADSKGFNLNELGKVLLKTIENNQY